MNSEIITFYENLNVLITGGTGLLGQLLIEKLFRVCPDIGGIYLILRSKQGKPAYDRLLAACKEPLFYKVREANPEFTKKIHVLQGDCSHLNLGIDQPSRQILIEKINVVFHCAATLNMEVKLEDAVNTNVRSLYELLQLCREMKELKSMVFVSTAYSNCIHKVIEEKFYPAPIKAATVMKLCEEMDSAVLKKITPTLMDKWPNTYCYSKAISENLIQQNLADLPLALFRPSVIMPTYTEPLSGWTSNLYGPIGFFLAYGMGISRVTFCDPHGRIDFIPADFCINALICTAWNTHKKFKEPNHVPVYNYSAGAHRNISIQLMTDYAEYTNYPLKNAMWATCQTITNWRIYYYTLEIFLHYLPGYLVDLYLFARGKKTRMIKSYKKLAKMAKVLSFFTCQQWDIKNDNVYKLWNELSETDKKLFPFDINSVDYKYFIAQCVLGIKMYVLKESLCNVEEEKKKYGRLVKVHKGVKLLLQVLAVIIAYQLFYVLFNYIF